MEAAERAQRMARAERTRRVREIEYCAVGSLCPSAFAEELNTKLSEGWRIYDKTAKWNDATSPDRGWVVVLLRQKPAEEAAESA